MTQELTEFSDDWIKKRLETQQLNGSQMIVDKETGYLQAKRGGGLTGAKKRSIIGSLNQRWNLSKALKTADFTNRKTFYDHLALDELFREHYLEALERHADEAEDFMIENAKFDKRATAERIFFLKKRRARVYGDELPSTNPSAEEDLIKKLADAMGKYTVIPSKSVIDAKDLNSPEKRDFKG